MDGLVAQRVGRGRLEHPLAMRIDKLGIVGCMGRLVQGIRDLDGVVMGVVLGPCFDAPNLNKRFIAPCIVREARKLEDLSVRALDPLLYDPV